MKQIHPIPETIAGPTEVLPIMNFLQEKPIAYPKPGIAFENVGTTLFADFPVPNSIHFQNNVPIKPSSIPLIPIQ